MWLSGQCGPKPGAVCPSTPPILASLFVLVLLADYYVHRVRDTHGKTLFAHITTATYMEAQPSPPINDGFWMRALTLVLFWISNRRWHRRWQKSGGGILFVSRRLCIRCAERTRLCEARAIQFVAEKTGGAVPVPKIYCSFERRGLVYILMECLPGKTLYDSRWVYRSAESKAKILEQLKGMVDAIRAIPPPTTFAVGNVDGGAFYDGNLPDKRFWGPYATIKAFHLDLRNNMASVPSVPGENNGDTTFPGLARLIDYHNGPFGPPVFTHGDLSSFNILVDEEDKISGIIDWETAAWMPAYWEYTNAWHVNPYNPFWQEEVDKFVTPDPEGLEMEKIRRQYFKDF